jgi:hypothetical protein
MGKLEKPSRTPAKRLKLGLAGFAKISAVEGIYLTRDMKGTFRALQRQRVSAHKRREIIAKKYGRSS